MHACLSAFANRSVGPAFLHSRRQPSTWITLCGVTPQAPKRTARNQQIRLPRLQWISCWMIRTLVMGIARKATWCQHPICLFPAPRCRRKSPPPVCPSFSEILYAVRRSPDLVNSCRHSVLFNMQWRLWRLHRNIGFSKLLLCVPPPPKKKTSACDIRVATTVKIPHQH